MAFPQLLSQQFGLVTGALFHTKWPSWGPALPWGAEVVAVGMEGFPVPVPSRDSGV